MAHRDAQPTRPQSSQRLSMTSVTSSAPNRPSSSRHHTHSVSLGSINTSNRVTRRKSTNASAVNNVNALRAALNDSVKGFEHLCHGQAQVTPARDYSSNGKLGDGQAYTESAIVDGLPPTSQHGNAPKSRPRRASEGSHLIKGEGKRSSAELRCETCGKGYKHSSCLAKHLWEHDPAWAVTSKLLISKHQQVQLLEAASVLVTMNTENDVEAFKPSESDNSSLSPGASGSSEANDDYDDAYSSAETTPPPSADPYRFAEGISSGRVKRSSGMSSSYSRSYQSAPSSSFPGVNDFSHYTSGMTGEEESGLAEAVQTLCSFGTPRSVPVLLPPDVPPVPPLPARYIEQQQQGSKSGTMFAQSDLGLPSPSYQPLSSERNVRTGNVVHNNDEHYDYYDRSMTQDRVDEDEGVFGGMEGIAHEAHEELSARHHAY